MQNFAAKTVEAKTFHKWLEDVQCHMTDVLSLSLKAYNSTSPVLQSAMEYSLLNGGKRIRAAMIYCLADEFSIASESLDGIAAAVETVHASSLIHDDLPALDNDDLRRGKPACHIAFNEAIAILAGDALLNLSQQIVLDLNTVTDSQKVQLCRILTHAVGTRGMIGGQALEFQDNSKNFKFEELKKLYQLKTGCLLGVGLEMVLTLAGLPNDKKALFAGFTDNLGLAFQIYDDILDIEGGSETLGKPKNSDKASETFTLIDCIGLDNAKELAQELQQNAVQSLNASGYSLNKLHLIADYIIQRKY